MSGRATLLGASLAALSLFNFVQAQDPSTLPPPAQLQPIKESDITGILPPVVRRQDPAADLALQDTENFYWGANGATEFVYANFSVTYDEPNQKIINMEKFSSMLKAVDCDESMNLDFNDQAGFDAAQVAWTWVNNEQANDVIMVANDNRCSVEQQRQPWKVTAMTFDAAALRVSMTAEQVVWQDVAHTYHLKVGHEPIPARRLRMRQDTDLSIPLTSDFSGSLDTASLGLTQDISVTLDCTSCGTAGALNVDFEIDVGFFTLNAASATVRPQDVAAFVELGVGISGNLTDPRTFDQEVVNIPIAGFEIPFVVTVGAFFTVDLGIELTVSGSAEVTFGARMEIPNEAIARVDLVGDSNEISGWDPRVTPIEPRLTAEIEASLSAFSAAGIKMEASALGFGFEISLDLRVPVITVSAVAQIDTAGVCGTTQLAGVGLKGDVGAELTINAGEAGSDPFFTAPLIEANFPLFDVCLPFGPEVAPPEEAPVDDLPPVEGEAPACTGTTQKVVEGDNCDTLSQAAGISREELIAANPTVDAECTNLVLDSDVCIPAPVEGEAPPAEDEAPPAEEAPACDGEILTVAEGDSCSSIATDLGITLEDFLAANPQIDAECTNLVLDSDVCIPVGQLAEGVPAEVDPAPEEAAPVEGAPAEEAPPADAPVEGEAPACSGATQMVVEGDDCENIAVAAGITREEFMAANPSLNAECTNLVLDTDVCVPAPAAAAYAAPAHRRRRHARQLL